MLDFSNRKHPVREAALGLTLFILASCGGSNSSDAPVAGTCDSSQATVASATFDELWTKVFSNQCGSCHGVTTDSSTRGGPNLKTADAFYTALVGKKASDYLEWDTYQDNRQGCHNYQFIRPESANQSVITAILDSSVSLPGCTVKYHRNESPQNVCITDANLVKLAEWINAGAAR
jgi:hypothetical protein